jgi:hypothetical protein
MYNCYGAHVKTLFMALILCDWRKYKILESIMVSSSDVSYFLGERDERCIQNFGPKTEEKRAAGRPRRKWEENTEMHFKEIRWESVNGTCLAQNRTRGRFLCTRQKTFGFHKIQRPAEQLLTFQEGLCSIELVIVFRTMLYLNICTSLV